MKRPDDDDIDIDIDIGIDNNNNNKGTAVLEPAVVRPERYNIYCAPRRLEIGPTAVCT